MPLRFPITRPVPVQPLITRSQDHPISLRASLVGFCFRSVPSVSSAVRFSDAGDHVRWQAITAIPAALAKTGRKRGHPPPRLFSLKVCDPPTTSSQI